MTVVKAVDLHHLYWPSSKESVSMDWKLTVTPFHIRYSNHRWPAFSCGVSSEKPQVCLEAVKLLNTTIRLKTDALRRIIWRIKSNQSVDAVSLSWRVDDDWWCQVIVASGKGIWELASSLTESKRITSQRSVCVCHSNLRNLSSPPPDCSRNMHTAWLLELTSLACTKMQETPISWDPCEISARNVAGVFPTATVVAVYFHLNSRLETRHYTQNWTWKSNGMTLFAFWNWKPLTAIEIENPSVETCINQTPPLPKKNLPPPYQSPIPLWQRVIKSWLQ